MAQRKSSTKTKKKEKRTIDHGIMFIHSTFNNTIITITDPDGKVLTGATGRGKGIEGCREFRFAHPGCPCQGTGSRPGKCDQVDRRHGLPGEIHQGYYPDSA
jgi:hypothetical protein